MLFHITPSKDIYYIVFLHRIFYIRPRKQLKIYKTIFSDQTFLLYYNYYLYYYSNLFCYCFSFTVERYVPLFLR